MTGKIDVQMKKHPVEQVRNHAKFSNILQYFIKFLFLSGKQCTFLIHKCEKDFSPM